MPQPFTQSIYTFLQKSMDTVTSMMKKTVFLDEEGERDLIMMCVHLRVFCVFVY